MERTIRAWIGNDYVEFEAELPTNMTEDEFYDGKQNPAVETH